MAPSLRARSAPATTVVVVPVKGFGEAKARLASHLGAEERRALAMAMASKVVAAGLGDGLAVIVVTGDDDVAEWAEARGAEVVTPAVSGLDAAADAGVAAARRLGATRVVIAHADLPLAATFRSVLDRDEAVVVVPDRHRDGTNVLCIGVDDGFGFHYGKGSFGRHVDQARRLGLTHAVVDDEALAWDVDEVDDLRHHAVDALRDGGRTTHRD